MKLGSQHKSYKCDIFGITLQSEIPIFNCWAQSYVSGFNACENQCNSANVQCFIRKLNDDTEQSLEEPVFWRINLNRSALTIFIHQQGKIEISSGRKISICSLDGRLSKIIELFFLGSAMGCILHQRALIPLHISTVFINGQAWGFTAPSGTGKSTLAARLHRFADCPMVSDDVAALYLIDGQPHVAGGPPLMKLSPEFADLFEGAHIEPIPHPESNKLKVQVNNSFIPGLVPLAGIVVLERDSEVEDGDLEIEPLKGSEAFLGAREAIYRYRMGLAMSSTVHMFNKLTELTHHVPFYRGRLGRWTVEEGRSPHAGQAETAIVERLASLSPQTA